MDSIESKNINILPPEVFNLIAAGEVVDRPSSIVKELVENAIDAKAKNIIIECFDGGITKIKITDDGVGILQGQLQTAFLPHTTSKVKTSDDLQAISTLGFRGEALASIAAVSTVTAQSCTHDNAIGSYITIKNGIVSMQREKACAKGTSITVENLFDNVPARKKFLKRKGTEKSYITSLVEKLIIANPTVNIRYLADGKEIFHSRGTGLKDAILSVWGSDFSNNILEVDDQKDDIKVYGFVGKSGFFKHNSMCQVFVVNGRIINDIGLSKVVSNCFMQYLVARQYPVFVLYIDVPLSDIDVNVHPNKTEVRFAQKDIVANVVYRVCKRVVQDFAFSPISPDVDNIGYAHNAYNSINIDIQADKESEINKDIKKFEEKRSSLYHNTKDNYYSQQIRKDTLDTNALKFFSSNGQSISESGQKSLIVDTNIIKDNNFFDNSKQSNDSIEYVVDNKNLQCNSFESAINDNKNDITTEYEINNYIIIGKLFNTYILIQENDNIYMIDQHAAHERVLYEKLCNQIDNNKIISQSLLVPYVFDTTKTQAELIKHNIDFLDSCGFEIREYGDKTFGIVGLPLICINIKLASFVSDLLTALDTNVNVSTSLLAKEKLEQIACKAAVKGEDDLNMQEIKSLMDQIKANGIEYFCPHGRPICIQITKKDIEKWFGRRQ